MIATTVAALVSSVRDLMSTLPTDPCNLAAAFASVHDVRQMKSVVYPQGVPSAGVAAALAGLALGVLYGLVTAPAPRRVRLAAAAVDRPAAE